jgi:hypothetical protein
VHRVGTCLVTLLAIATFTSCPGPIDNPVPPPPSTAGVKSVFLMPVPEGPSSPLFTLHPTNGQFPLAAIRSAIPYPLPSPIDQTCTVGGDVVIRLRGARTIMYGPCKLPPSIEMLKAAMLAYLENHHA